MIPDCFERKASAVKTPERKKYFPARVSFLNKQIRLRFEKITTKISGLISIMLIKACRQTRYASKVNRAVLREKNRDEMRNNK